MLTDLKHLIEKYKLNITGIIFIGANRGQYVNYFLDITDKLVCFEPVKENFEHLKNYASEKVKIFNCGLGDENKTLPIFVSSNEGQSCSFLRPKDHLLDYPHVKFTHTEDCEMKKLTNFQKEINGCNYIDIDVQGFEFEVLIGAGALLEKIDYIYMEVNRSETYENNKQVEKIDEYLKNYNLVRVQTHWEARTWGDALYVRKSNLKDTTFIIPLIDSTDQEIRNANITVNYLLSRLETNVFVCEVSKEKKFDLQISGLKHFYFESCVNSSQIVNDIALMTNTDFIAYYDPNILLPFESYFGSIEKLKTNSDIVYPYFYNNSGKKIVNLDDHTNYNFLKQNYNLNVLEGSYSHIDSFSSDCFFIKRDVFLKSFMENENFYCDEIKDIERYNRHIKLGHTVSRLENYIYYLNNNKKQEESPFYENNYNLFLDLDEMSKEDLVAYYIQQEYYLKKQIQCCR